MYPSLNQKTFLGREEFLLTGIVYMILSTIRADRLGGELELKHLLFGQIKRA